MNWELEDLEKALKSGNVKINEKSPYHPKKSNKNTTISKNNTKNPTKKQKLNNKPSWIDGMFFRSKLEGKKYNQLKMLNQGKAIKGFCMQPLFILTEGTDKDNRAITYKADFIVFYNDNTYEIIDTKGMETQQFKRVKKMFRNKYPELYLKIEKEV
ncbi:DUF1064 domain-containing protein [Senegalia massiliensis]|uniref:DUF1064 domain-containing protein n=1 Tax=Senegalia massiliensis TaxID=1720316 RepID=UPI0010301EAE|nr:DUF1064 domain-containing protein [Senegalia massiliensis]